MENYIDYLKEGSGIHIKKKNRGKFTKSAKAAGESVQEHAHKVMNDPNATPLQRKRANFAIQAKKWHKHFEGGIIKAADGSSLFINTGRVVSKNNQLTDEKYKQFAEEISKSTDIPELEFETPEDEKKESVVVKKEDDQPWTTAYRAGGDGTNSLSSNQSSETSTITPIRKTYTTANRNENREKLRTYLKNRGLDDETTEALLVHAGAESGYNHQIKNPNSSAYGLGQWITTNHKPILDYINEKNGTNYSNLTQLSFDDLAEALAWWYYDRNKQLLDRQNGAYNKVKALAKIGLAPAIVSQGLYTWNKNGKTYRDTDEDWLAWFVDTGHDPNKKLKTFDDHIAARYRHAGYV